MHDCHGRGCMGGLRWKRRPRGFTVSPHRCKVVDITILQCRSISRENDMAVTQAIPITRHPYADGSYKKMLIDGKWVDAASGKKFETLNPATGELLATVAEGDAEDINRAVVAARRAFEGPWSKVK